LDGWDAQEESTRALTMTTYPPLPLDGGKEMVDVKRGPMVELCAGFRPPDARKPVPDNFAPPVNTFEIIAAKGCLTQPRKTAFVATSAGAIHTWVSSIDMAPPTVQYIVTLFAFAATVTVGKDLQDRTFSGRKSPKTVLLLTRTIDK
jgi:hypothetical protein